MRKWIVLFFLACGPAVAQEMPPHVIGHIPMNQNGKFILTGESCRPSPGDFFAYLRDQGGKVLVTACWNLVGEQILVKYEDGDRYSYDVDKVVFTAEFDAWSKRNEQRKKSDREGQTL